MKKILIFLLTIFSLFTLSMSSNQTMVEAVSSSYYSGTENLTGDALLNKLAEITLANHKTYNTYGDTRYVAAKTDGDPNNSKNFLDLYTRLSVNATWDGGATWNREHVWCKSLSGGLFTTVDNYSKGAGADIHHIRPTYESVNTSRSNKPYTDFDWITATGSAKYYNGALAAYTNSNYWEPIDEVKGDIARILMYLYMHYSTEVSYNKINHSNYSGALKITSIVYAGGSEDKAWDLLLYWNDLDKVDEFEATRNEECAKITGTRNPFIDNMDFCDAIWGDGSDVQIPSSYTVNFQLPENATFNYSDNTKYVSGAKIIQPTVVPTLEGFKFDGWYIDSDYTTRWNFLVDTISSDLTLYAKFTLNNADQFESIFDDLVIKSQLTFDVFNGAVDSNSLKLKYVVQLTSEQYELFLNVKSSFKFYINDLVVRYDMLNFGNEYRLVYSINVSDTGTLYVPKITYNNLSKTIDGYSAKTLAEYYLANLSSNYLVDDYKEYLLEISK